MKILRCFLNTNLAGSHNYLTRICEANKVDVKKLCPGDMVIFINKKKTMMKVYTANNTIAFTKKDRIDLEAIQYLPKIFESTAEVSYDRAIKIRLEELIKRKESP